MPTLAVRFAVVARGPDVGRVVAAQAMSWGGDLALTRPGRRPFLGGLTSFLAAHLLYVSAFRRRSSTGVLDDPRRRALLAGGGVLTTAMAVAAAREHVVLGPAVAVYGTVLTTMVAAADAVDADRGRRQVLAGAWLFLVSDLLIGVRRFLGHEDSSALHAAVLATYVAGQWGISSGMARP